VSAPEKKKAREVWEAIDETSFRAEVDRVNAMSDAEVEAELLKEGFDPADLGSSAGETASPPATTAPVRRLPLARRFAPWAAAAAVALLLGGVAALKKSDDVTRTPAEHAAALRESAREACAKAQWRTCLDRLDKADKYDAVGADDPRVRSLRHEAEQGLGGTGTGAPR
jgi:hypothetical protein